MNVRMKIRVTGNANNALVFTGKGVITTKDIAPILPHSRSLLVELQISSFEKDKIFAVDIKIYLRFPDHRQQIARTDVITVHGYIDFAEIDFTSASGKFSTDFLCQHHAHLLDTDDCEIGAGGEVGNDIVRDGIHPGNHLRFIINFFAVCHYLSPVE